GFSFLITHDQVGIHLLHFLSYEAELRCARWINVLLVAEANWFERKNRFAGPLHWLDVVFEPRRGGNCAKLPRRIHKNRYPAGGSGSADAGDKRGGVKI